MAQSRRVRVAVDAMGGDYAPGEIVKGAILAAQQDNVEISLVGPINILERELARNRFSNNGSLIHCVEASQVIRENEPPVLAIRRKPNCSIAVAAKLVKAGQAEALFSAGHSGAVAVGAVKYLGMLDGIQRPAIGGSLGSFASNVVMMDLGANVDCRPHQLLAFAIAGSVYARKFLNIANPKVGLLNTGSEEGKGNALVRETYTILKNSGLNFIGNVEGNDILSGKADVIVCDGFVGNVVLKFYESIGDGALQWTKKKLKKYPLLPEMAELLFHRLFPVAKMSRETEEDGAGILWGVDGVVRIAHGASRAPQIALGITSAGKAVRTDIIGCLKSELLEFKNGGK